MFVCVACMASCQVVLEITEDDILEICFEIVVVGWILKSKHSVAWLRIRLIWIKWKLMKCVIIIIRGWGS